MIKYIQNTILKRRINAVKPFYDAETTITMSAAPWDAVVNLEPIETVTGAFTEAEIAKRVAYCKSLLNPKISRFSRLKQWFIGVYSKYIGFKGTH